MLKRSKLIAQAAFTISVLSSALMSQSARADISTYEKLAQLYSSGTLPTVDNMTGVSVGRCFSYDKPMTPIAKATILQGAEILAPEGPLVGKVMAFSAYFYSSAAYNALDEIDSISGVEQTLGRSLTPSGQLHPAHVEGTALVAPFKSGQYMGKNSAKINGPYIVVQHFDAASTSVAAYCYFFRKIMNP